MEETQAPVIGVVVESYWECCVVGLWDQVIPDHSAGLLIGFVAELEEMAVAPWGGDNGSLDFFLVVTICLDGWGWKHVYP